MNKKEFLKLVETEVNYIKDKAFKKEIKNLDFDALKPSQWKNCIYGQMTGSCFSKRAGILIRGMGQQLFQDIGAYESFTEWKKSWKSKDREFNYHNNRGFSPLEVYITLKGAKDKEIVEYLKGERKTLKL